MPLLGDFSVGDDMREIKFRAWAGSPKRMIVVCELIDSAYFRLNTGYILDNVEQFTGLHDKNGKEIYEGDILTNSNGNCNYAISWSRKSCRFIGKGNDGDKYGPYTLKISIASRYEENLFKNELEIIGNIHENPELLVK